MSSRKRVKVQIVEKRTLFCPNKCGYTTQNVQQHFDHFESGVCQPPVFQRPPPPKANIIVKKREEGLVLENEENEDPGIGQREEKVFRGDEEKGDNDVSHIDPNGNKRPSTSASSGFGESESESESEESGSDDEEDKGDDDQKEEEIKLTARGEFILSLQKLTRNQFDDKEYFKKLVDDENEKGEKRRGKYVPIDADVFSWTKGELKMKIGNRLRPLEHVSSFRRYYGKYMAKQKKEGSHQTYIVITIPRKDITGKSVKQIWEYVKDGARQIGWYVGQTFGTRIGARKRHFQKPLIRNGLPHSAIHEEMLQHDSRAFEVAVIITSSEVERIALEEFIIRYLMEQEEHSDWKMLNKSMVLKLLPEVRSQAAALFHDGTPLVRFEEQGKTDPNKRYELGFVCTPKDFKEQQLKYRLNNV